MHPFVGHALQSTMVKVKPEQSAVPDSDYALGAPLIAFEIVSPSESAFGSEANSLAYLEAGARVAVWIYPKTRTVHTLGEGERRLNDKDTLELPSILPTGPSPSAASSPTSFVIGWKL